MYTALYCPPFEILIELLLILQLRNKYDSDDMTSTCIFADTLVRDHSEKCHEYYESIILEFPVSMAGLRLVFQRMLKNDLLSDEISCDCCALERCAHRPLPRSL